MVGDLLRGVLGVSRSTRYHFIELYWLAILMCCLLLISRGLILFGDPYGTFRFFLQLETVNLLILIISSDFALRCHHFDPILLWYRFNALSFDEWNLVDSFCHSLCHRRRLVKLEVLQRTIIHLSFVCDFNSSCWNRGKWELRNLINSLLGPVTVRDNVLDSFSIYVTEHVAPTEPWWVLILWWSLVGGRGVIFAYRAR